jgi:PKD repeat protein
MDTDGGSVPLRVEFNATSSTDPDGTIVSYAWTFGDGEVASHAQVAHTYDAAGLFVVELTVRDDRGDVDSAKDTVYVSSRAGTGENSIQGTVWFDRDLDDVRDPQELGLSRFIVFLDEDTDGEIDSGEPLVFTGGDGAYRFEGLDGGRSYRVTQALPFGWSNTLPGAPQSGPARSPGRWTPASSTGPAAIINGEETGIEGFPFQVALILKDFDFQFCGGTLITSQWVLTAAHCVEERFPDEVEVLIGTADLEQGGERYAVTAIRVNPVFRQAASLDSDVALILLDRPLLSPRVYLQTPDQEALAAPGITATVIGWGQTEGGGQPTRLRRVDIPIISNAQCNDLAGEIYGLITAATICAGGVNLQKGPCFGDSGGPLLVTFQDGWMQVGIVSFAVGRQACGDLPAAFARVSALLDYVTSVVPIEKSGAYTVDWSSGPVAQVDFANYH